MTWNDGLSKALPGDAVFFWGKGSILSDGIELITGGPSHVATIYDQDLLLPNGAKQEEMHVVESTILKGVNGVQLNPLSARTASYEGTVAIASLSARVRAFLDWKALWGCANSKLGVVKYNVIEIAAYLANLVLPGTLQLDKSDPKAVVCSELRTELLQAGGLPGLDPYRTPPEKLFVMRMYSELCVLGPAKLEDKWLKGFNSV